MSESVTGTTSYSALRIPRPAFTVERLAYVVIFVVAAGLRFLDLGEQVLLPLEAAQSWPAWLAALGLSAPNPPVPDSALLFSLQSTLFWLTQGNDGLARTVSALAGTLLVLTPWIMRGWLGRTSALVLALLLAIDPWLISFSRVADGAILSVALMLFTLAALMRISQPITSLKSSDAESRKKRRREPQKFFEDSSDALPQNIERIQQTHMRTGSQYGWLAWAAVAGGLLLVSGSLAWSFLPILLLFAATFTLPALAEQGMKQVRRRGLPLLALFIGAAILGATGWLARPQGLGYISRSMDLWLAQFQGGEYPLIWTLLRLLVDQPFSLIFGGAGFILLWRRRNSSAARPALPGQSWPLFLTAWLAWGIIWQLLPGRTPQALLVLGLPLLFTAAYAGAALIEAAPSRVNWREAGLLLALLTVLWISGRIWLNSFASSATFDLTLALISVLIVMASLLLVSAFSLWSNWARVRWFAGLFVAVWLLLATIGSGWQLARAHDASHPKGFFATVSHPGLRVLVSDVETLSAQRRGDPTEIGVQVQMAAAPDPLLGWYLRDMRRLSWARVPQADGSDDRPPLLITEGTAAENAAANMVEQLSLPAGYLGSDYRLRYHWLPDQLTNESTPAAEASADAGPLARLEPKLDAAWRGWGRPTLRWMLYREAPEVYEADGVVLWVMQRE